MKIAIFGRITDNTDFESLFNFFSYIKGKEVPFILFEKYAKQLTKAYPTLLEGMNITCFSLREELVSCRFVVCLGGDGTVLEAVRFTGPLSKPIMGINFGRLGYLSSASKQMIVKATQELLSDKYKIDERTLITVLSNPPGLFGVNNFGINDLTIHKSNTNEMITVHTYLNGEFLNSYWGDGLIVSTPTGSTAYNLSAGGPIIFPNSGSLAITPIAPHSLTVRPVVIPDKWTVAFEIQSRSGEAMVALDTRTEKVQSMTSIAIRKADFKARLVRVSATSYLDNLRKGLMWGSDNRN